MLEKEAQIKWKKVAPTVLVIFVLLLSSSIPVTAKNNENSDFTFNSLSVSWW